MSGRTAGLALLFAGRAALAGAQGTLVVRDPGSGPGTEIVPAALTSPYRVVGIGPAADTVAAGAAVDRTLIVLGRDVVIDGTVHGDVIAINGGVFIHPGAVVDGRAIAIGGEIYGSTLARIGRGVTTIRDFSYDVEPIRGGFALTYRANGPKESHTILAGVYGLLEPSYDRTDGLSVPLGLSVAVGRRLTLAPRATGRSQLGRIDPWIDIVDSVGRGGAVSVAAGRGTFTNDAWIFGNLVNTLESFFVGNDTRNYFRGTRGEVRAAWDADTGSLSRGVYVGYRGEHALTARPGLDPSSGPWSVIGRRGDDDMLRPNPGIDNGVDNSAILGGHVQSLESEIRTRAEVSLELGSSKLDVIGGAAAVEKRFAQLTFDGSIGFPTFGVQSLRFDGHVVLTSRGATPRQRWVYLGGSGTLPTLERLSLGGDQLVFLNGRYNIPITRFAMPMLGPPVLALRDAIGGAAVGKAPSLHQNIGAQLAAGPAYVELMVDPVTHRGYFGGGISLLR